MQNFVYCNPTELVFGRGAHKEIGMRMLPWAKDGKKALVIYGGGSAKRSGVLDDVVAGCEAAGLTVVVKGGVTLKWILCVKSRPLPVRKM